MGIKNLYKFISNHSKKCIKYLNWGDLSNKTILVDISIYVHKYASVVSNDLITLKCLEEENLTKETAINIVKTLMEQSVEFYLTNMINQAYSNSVELIFIADGQRPELKKNTINKRTNLANRTAIKINEAFTLFDDFNKKQITDTNIDNLITENIDNLITENIDNLITENINDVNTADDKSNLISLNILKNETMVEISVNEVIYNLINCICKYKHYYVNKSIVNYAIEYLKQCGMKCITAPYEAESYAANLCRNNFTCSGCKKCINGICYGSAPYAVLSEDSDTLAFGGNKLLRFTPKNMIDNANKSVFVEYDLDILLKELNITYYQFVDICIILGNDYFNGVCGIGLVSVLQTIKKYKKFESIVFRKEEIIKKYPEYYEVFNEFTKNYSNGIQEIINISSK